MSSCNGSSLTVFDLHPTSVDLTSSRTMDQVLKARKMSSASAKRKKNQERQQQQALERETFEEHKRRILMYDHLADRLYPQVDDSEDNAAYEVDTDIGRFDRESSAETWSERSALTPDDTMQDKARYGGQMPTGTDTFTPLKIQIPDEAEVLQRMDLDDGRVVIPPPSPKPLLQASLATLADFRYDRYSVILDSPLSEVLSPELDTDETFSPIETATPISYQQPKSRPSLISIVSISHRSKRRTASLQSPLSQMVPQMVPQTVERPTKRQSTSSVRPGFPAAEATLFEVPSLPQNAFELIANASQESLLLSTKERPRSKAERKSSMPRLSTALSHARMSSIKSLIKTPTASTPTPTHRRSFSRPSSHTSRPSTASIPAADVASLIKNPAAMSSTSNLSSMTRPPTSHNSSISVGGLSIPITALPSLPTPPADDDVTDPLASKPAMQRKKSFSALRRRSESIGQAIKGLSKIATKHDVPVPTTPSLMTPKKSQPFDSSKFPTPPLPSPHTGKCSAGSFTSTWTRSSGGYIGLGLQSVEGFSQR